MKTKRTCEPIRFALLIFVISGCTHQAWYEGLKEGAKNNCRGQPPSEVERCLQGLNKKTYEEYEKERPGEK